MSAPSTEAIVLQNAAYHAQLLSAIEELDYVPAALTQQESYVAGLKAERAQAAARVRVLERRTTKERKEHEALRDSTARRLAHKLTGRKEKFEAKTSKEEREYVEALEKEMQEKRQLATLETLLAEAQAVQADLVDKAQRHELTKDDLGKLYAKIFDGITQGYPEDDRLEEQVKTSQQKYTEIQMSLNQEAQALSLLDYANKALAACRREVKDALGYSQWDMWGGGTMSDMMERNALSKAEGHAIEARMYVQQANMASPRVQLIGDINIAHGSIMGDVIFDNIFSDMAFHDKIKATARNVEAVQRNLTNEITAATRRTNAIGAELDAAAGHLTRARAALDTFRRNVFDSLTGEAPPLPAYSDSDSEAQQPGADAQVGVEFPQPGGGSSGSRYAPPTGPPPPSGPSLGAVATPAPGPAQPRWGTCYVLLPFPLLSSPFLACTRWLIIACMYIGWAPQGTATATHDHEPEGASMPGAFPEPGHAPVAAAAAQAHAHYAPPPGPPPPPSQNSSPPYPPPSSSSHPQSKGTGPRSPYASAFSSSSAAWKGGDADEDGGWKPQVPVQGAGAGAPTSQWGSRNPYAAALARGAS
ncbi:hypothetical protein B0H11DRAFT_2288736 [Mycena galericulata]|nr:hypothetical protein B0H11DRAFT_2288736 [Mycena galericulata]